MDIAGSGIRTRACLVRCSCVLTIEPTRRRTSSRTLIQQYIYICILVLYTVYAMHGNYYTHLYGRTTCKICMMKTHTKIHPGDRTQPREKFTSPAPYSTIDPVPSTNFFPGLRFFALGLRFVALRLSNG